MTAESGNATVPPCSSDVCGRYRDQIAALCRRADWPPGQPVLIIQPDGTLCACTCGGAATTPAGEGAGENQGDVIQPCQDTACYLDPRMIEACQQAPAGQSVMLEGPKGYCYCYCWGGKLAPYTVADGEGVQVPLDAIPVGGFVTAAGLDLQWRRMLVRWASRPYQSSPQQAYAITVGGQTMQVPSSHMFLTAHRRLILARQMNLSIPLMAVDGSAAPVESIEVVSIHDAFQFVATADVDPGPDLLDHLLNSQGVVSADHAVEKAYQERRIPRRLLAFPYGS